MDAHIRYSQAQGKKLLSDERHNWSKHTHTYSYSQKYFAFLKYINFKEKMLREGIILKYVSYILINLTRGTQK